MKISCTKKLLDYLEITPQTPGTEDPLFALSANLLVLNRRKCIAVFHEASGCGFLLYGITAKDKKNIQSKLEAGLRNLLASENISGDVIDRYLADCAFPAALCKNTDRSAVTRLNHFCKRIEWLTNCYEPDDTFQTMLLPKINDDLRMMTVDGEKEVFAVYEELARLLQERYGRLYHCRAGVFDVTLKLATPCVRRVTVPLDFPMYYLHDVIQQLFLWQDYHGHDFITKVKKNGRPAQIVTDPAMWEEGIFAFQDLEVLDEQKIRLSDIFPGTDRIFYEYDFGDGWEHEIRLVEIIEDADLPAPVCTEMTGDAPPEDCGGPYGFAELQRILNDPKDPEYEEMREWCAGMRYWQKNIRLINSNLRRRYLAGAWDLYFRFADMDDAWE